VGRSAASIRRFVKTFSREQAGLLEHRTIPVAPCHLCPASRRARELYLSQDGAVAREALAKGNFKDFEPMNVSYSVNRWSEANVIGDVLTELRLVPSHLHELKDFRPSSGRTVHGIRWFFGSLQGVLDSAQSDAACRAASNPGSKFADGVSV